MRRINSRHNPVVVRFRRAARGDDAALLLDGVHLVTEALHAGCRIRLVVIAADALDRADVARLADALASQGADVAAAARPVMDAVSPVRSSSPIVALGDRPAIGPSRVYGPTALVLVAVDVQDPGNIGAIARVAEAAGATGLIAAGASADPFGWKALRGSMGSALRVPIVVEQDSARAAAEARRHGCRVIASVPHDGRPLFETRFSGPVAILIGGEGAGLPPALVAAADERVTIPMAAPVESLNAAVAAALIAYEARRQRVNGR